MVMGREYHREYSRKYYTKIRSELINKLGGKCRVCGSINSLEFDHVDPTIKKFSIGKFLSYPKEEIEKEVSKCRLLCEMCHNKRHEGLHGTYPKYTHGCRCIDCTKVNTERSRQYRLRKKGLIVN
jgi:5-methylcytosine-specific restriction endonuclease McrA